MEYHISVEDGRLKDDVWRNAGPVQNQEFRGAKATVILPNGTLLSIGGSSSGGTTELIDVAGQWNCIIKNCTMPHWIEESLGANEMYICPNISPKISSQWLNLCGHNGQNIEAKRGPHTPLLSISLKRRKTSYIPLAYKIVGINGTIGKSPCQA